MTTVRSWLNDTITIPTDWVWIPAQRVPDTISKITVVTKHKRISPLDDSPIGALQHDIILSVFTPEQNIATAEDALDDAVTALITDIDGHDLIRFVSAEKVVSPNEKYFGWDITLTVITNPEPEEA